MFTHTSSLLLQRGEAVVYTSMLIATHRVSSTAVTLALPAAPILSSNIPSSPPGVVAPSGRGLASRVSVIGVVVCWLVVNICSVASGVRPGVVAPSVGGLASRVSVIGVVVCWLVVNICSVASGVRRPSGTVLQSTMVL